MSIFVFDMDGTLTPARLPMEKDFSERFGVWQKANKSFIATGSDFAKVREQLPEDIIDGFTGLYTSMGNVLIAHGKQVYQKDFAANEKLFAMLENFRQTTEYTGTLYPNYIERRIGMVNFSVLGRNCPYEAREEYAKWDEKVHEREHIAEKLRNSFPQYEVSIGGSISIDITPNGCGKGQIARHLRECYPHEKIIFFGDKTYAGGNDYELAEALRNMDNTEVVQVDGPNNVLQYLER